MKPSVCLAYSGGLDTSVMLKWYLEKGYEVTCFVADVGQKEDFKEVESKALSIGAKEVIVLDLKEELVTEYLFPSVQAGALYEGKYYLGTALARPLIAKKMVEVAKSKGIKALSHGATGKGNDQIRFELVFASLYPEAEILSPWKEEDFLKAFQGRADLIAYAKEKHIPIKASLKKPYSIDENVIHTSYEGGELESLSYFPEETTFEKTVSLQEAPDQETELALTFEKGIPTVLSFDAQVHTDPLEILEMLNELAGKNGIGRADIVESRVIGMKSRGMYETPGAAVLYAAHSELESICQDGEVMQLKATWAPKIAALIYAGLWFSPECQVLFSAVKKSQEKITGSVSLILYKGNITVKTRSSSHALYEEELASMESVSSFDQKDAKGFIKIMSLRLGGVSWM